MRRPILLLTLGGIVVAAAFSQNALDRSLAVGRGRVNPAAPRPAMAAPIYSVNHNTGGMTYNRANAFRDPAYNLYQSRGFNLFQRTKPYERRDFQGVAPAQGVALQPATYTRNSVSAGSYAPRVARPRTAPPSSAVPSVSSPAIPAPVIARYRPQRRGTPERSSMLSGKTLSDDVLLAPVYRVHTSVSYRGALSER